jgi:hypothetical protein
VQFTSFVLLVNVGILSRVLVIVIAYHTVSISVLFDLLIGGSGHKG